MEEGTRYIQILRGSLEKKERLLNNLLEITKQQSECIQKTEFDMDEFDELMNIKQEMIDELNAVDDGFESIFERIRDFLKEHKQQFASQIIEMQNRIREITNLSVSLQALEERNRKRLEVVFAQKQREINQHRKSNNAVNNYYNTMTGVGMGNSVFFNKSK